MSTGLPTIDGFSQLQLIGSGGFSHVYSASQDEFKRAVALKVLKFRIDSEAERARFEGECQAMAQLSDHPHIVSLYSTTYTTQAFPVIVMELFAGGTFAGVTTGDTPKSLDVGVKIASALHFAHAQGVIHRDVKPKNILLSRFGEPALTDFGISAIAERAQSEQSYGVTLAYAPPEALDGAVDERSDIYSLAATLYTSLAGHHPHGAAGKQPRTELARRILYEDPPPLRSRGLGPHFDTAIVRKGLAKDPRERPSTAPAFAELLRDLQRQEGHDVTSFVQSGAPNGNADVVVAGEHGRDLDPSVTIIRARGAAPATETPKKVSKQWTPRQLVAAGAGATALGLLALVLVFGNGGNEPEIVAGEDVPTQAPVVDTGLYAAQVLAPTNVQLSRQPGGSVLITWSDPNTAAVEFEIQRLDGVASTQAPVVVTGTSHVLGQVSDVDSPCITMRALGAAGGISRDIDKPVCVGVDMADFPVIALIPDTCAAGECSIRIDVGGLVPNGSVSIVVEDPDGVDVNSTAPGAYDSTAQIDALGAVDWSFSPGSLAPPGNYRVVLTDTLNGQSSVGFFEIIEP